MQVTRKDWFYSISPRRKIKPINIILTLASCIVLFDIFTNFLFLARKYTFVTQRSIDLLTNDMGFTNNGRGVQWFYWLPSPCVVNCVWTAARYCGLRVLGIYVISYKKDTSTLLEHYFECLRTKCVTVYVLFTAVYASYAMKNKTRVALRGLVIQITDGARYRQFWYVRDCKLFFLPYA